MKIKNIIAIIIAAIFVCLISDMLYNTFKSNDTDIAIQVGREMGLTDGEIALYANH